MAEPNRLHILTDKALDIYDGGPIDLPEGYYFSPDLGIEKLEQTSYTPIRCRIDANVTVTGLTGNTYLFRGGGSVVEVAKADVPKLLNMRLGGALCCGDATTNIMFELA